MVVNAARNLKERFRFDNNQSHDNMNAMDIDQEDELNQNPAEEQDSGTKRMQEDDDGPTTAKGEGDTPLANNNEQEKVNKIRKANEDAMEEI